MLYRIGKVVEVFLPNDDIESKDIGFKIKFDDEIVEYVVKQNEDNCKVMREDLVFVKEKVISGVKYIDIEVYDDGQ